MWKSALKQIWKNKKSNGWIFVEIMVASVLLWYCVDFLYVIIRKNMEPMGVNTEHVYCLNLGANQTKQFDRNNIDSINHYWIKPFEQIVKLVNAYPGVEATAYFAGTDVFTEGPMFQGYTADEKNAYGAKIRYVSEGFDKVFKMDRWRICPMGHCLHAAKSSAFARIGRLAVQSAIGGWQNLSRLLRAPVEISSNGRFHINEIR